MKKKIAILGSTGSIGKTLVEIAKKDKKNFEIKLLTTNQNIKELISQIKIFNVKNIIVTNYKKFLQIKKKIKNNKINIYNDFSQIENILKNIKLDYTMNAISGIQGLDPTIRIIKFTKKIAIANKESIICGWSLIKKELKKNNTKFIPVDSEHFSIYSLMGNTINNNIEKVFITASGGPFKDYPLNKFQSITPKLALNHPNWKMGKKITIDSATMMNKVFEIIEAKKIFALKYEKLSILIHPKSYVHAIVKFSNGLIKMLIHDTNMTIPIFNSIYSNHEKKIKSNTLNLSIINNLRFDKVDKKRFPIIELLKKLPEKDTLFETVIVSANDTLVHLFLNKKIKFTDISKVLLRVVLHDEFRRYKYIKPKNIEQILKLNQYVSLKTTTFCI